MEELFCIVHKHRFAGIAALNDALKFSVVVINGVLSVVIKRHAVVAPKVITISIRSVRMRGFSHCGGFLILKPDLQLMGTSTQIYRSSNRQVIIICLPCKCLGKCQSSSMRSICPLSVAQVPFAYGMR